MSHVWEPSGEPGNKTGVSVTYVNGTRYSFKLQTSEEHLLLVKLMELVFGEGVLAGVTEFKEQMDRILFDNLTGSSAEIVPATIARNAVDC